MSNARDSRTHARADALGEDGRRRLHCQADLQVPVDEAFALWLDLESLPRVLDAVRRVKRIGDRRVLWEVDIAGRQLVWEAELTAIESGKRIAWETRSGALHAGEVRFCQLAPGWTRIEVEIVYRPRGWMQRLGAWLGLVRRQVDIELALFRRFAERETHEAYPQPHPKASHRAR